jgi:hypothetical protein
MARTCRIYSARSLLGVRISARSLRIPAIVCGLVRRPRAGPQRLVCRKHTCTLRRTYIALTVELCQGQPSSPTDRARSKNVTQAVSSERTGLPFVVGDEPRLARNTNKCHKRKPSPKNDSRCPLAIIGKRPAAEFATGQMPIRPISEARGWRNLPPTSRASRMEHNRWSTGCTTFARWQHCSHQLINRNVMR